MLISPKYPDLNVEDAAAYYYVEQGKSISKIAKGLGLSRMQIHRALLRKGIELRGANARKTSRECQFCGAEKDLTPEFWHYSNKAAGTFQRICKTCRAASGK